MIDVALIRVKAGDGGDGLVHFRREKYVPKGGPDGGDGGDGGSVYLVAEPNLRTLDYFAGREKFEASRGRPGRKQKQTGPDGEDIWLKVPVGTVVWEVDQVSSTNDQSSNNQQSPNSNHQNVTKKEVVGWLKSSRKGEEVPMEKLGEIDNRNNEMVVAKGGVGGRGNDRFKSATNQTPMEADEGTPGEDKWLVLELKLLADVGLVGLPNAGKSTLLSVLTAARPKIADYPFTTLEPNLGVMRMGGISRLSGVSHNTRSARDDKAGLKSLPALSNKPAELVLADIPGLIEGASDGKGLGDEFLRHIERCRVLVHVIELKLNPKSEIRNPKQIQNTNDLSSKQTVEQLFSDYQTVRRELLLYHESLVSKPEVVVVNKMDLLDAERSLKFKAQIVKHFGKNGVDEVEFVSAVTGEGLGELRERLMTRV